MNSMFYKKKVEVIQQLNLFARYFRFIFVLELQCQDKNL